MFTGLIENIGRLVALSRTGSAARLKVAAEYPAGEVNLGDSIAVNGVCLTVTTIDGDTLSFDTSPETLEHSTFRILQPGARVNLERALRVSSRLDGHIVSGHVDCIATVVERRPVSGNVIFTFAVPPEHARFIAAKGSVAVDGISLTVNTVEENRFTVNIIPLTADHTTLSERKPGDQVNVETDILAKYMERLLSFRGCGDDGGVTLELLAKSGFM
ncbi:riboflavin synthase [Geobacter sp. DSM 9736]|uniref:riboflavin synthase n=1 Tax=Geobacter sp. DSM 9736 TaxID=1277350 RepID=UPI000B5101C7|nr:riboflavin synthase [Geobacter sp. DSM 9736]SNB45105.1 riboflavin synthase alpha chain [Geobacter sp. DSM 9736]